MTTKMSRLAIILCIVGFFASKTIANPEPQQKLLTDIDQAKNDITRSSLQVLEQIENFGSLKFFFNLRLNHSSGETVEQHFLRIHSIVNGYLSNLTTSSPNKTTECLDDFHRRQAYLGVKANIVFTSVWTTFVNLLQLKRQSEDTLKKLEAKVPFCKDYACVKIENNAELAKNAYLDFAKTVQNIYVKVGNGSALLDLLVVTHTKDKLETYSQEDQQMLKDIYTCLLKISDESS